MPGYWSLSVIEAGIDQSHCTSIAAPIGSGLSCSRSVRCPPPPLPASTTLPLRRLRSRPQTFCQVSLRAHFPGRIGQWTNARGAQPGFARSRQSGKDVVAAQPAVSRRGPPPLAVSVWLADNRTNGEACPPAQPAPCRCASSPPPCLTGRPVRHGGASSDPDRLQRAEAAFAALPFEPRGAGFLLTKAVTTNAAQKATAKVTVKPKAKKYAKVTITKAGKITIKNDRQEEVDPVGPQAPWQVPAGIHTSICMP